MFSDAGLQSNAHEREPGEPMSSGARRTAAIVVAILLAAAAVIITIVVVNANNAAAQKAKDDKAAHDKQVSSIYNECTNYGSTGWNC